MRIAVLTGGGDVPGLNSAMKQVVYRAQKEGIEVIEKDLTKFDLYVADEFFLTGTAAEVTPIRELDNRVIGSGTRGPR